MPRFLLHWGVVTLALGVAAWLLPGVRIESWPALALGGLVLGLVNAVVRPVLAFLAFPITLITLGLFILVVNAIAFSIAAALTPGFEVTSLGQAILGALVTSVVSWLLANESSPRTVASE